MPTLSVVVFTTPEMKHLAQCLESVQWADAVSLHHLNERGESLSVEEIKRGPVDGQSDWYLVLWAEESVEAELRDELHGILAGSPTAAPSSYRIPVRSRLPGGWAGGSVWGPSPARRLLRRPTSLPPGWWDSTWREKGGAHDRLQASIADYSLSDLSAGVDSVNRCATLSAARIQAKNLNFGPMKAILDSFTTFARLLWMNGVFTGGLAALTLAALAAYANLLSGAKLWEARNTR